MLDFRLTFHFALPTFHLLLPLQRQHVLARSHLRKAGRRIEAERFGHVLDLRQVAQVLQPEPNQEFLGRRVEERPADDVLAADDLDQVTLEQRREDARRVDAADLGDLRAR